MTGKKNLTMNQLIFDSKNHSIFKLFFYHLFFRRCLRGRRFCLLCSCVDDDDDDDDEGNDGSNNAKKNGSRCFKAATVSFGSINSLLLKNSSLCCESTNGNTFNSSSTTDI
ncbi:hypothetical protein DERF_013583 [Dermatophagoides farinae]|uniref:Uncharacterized protein n=1 Tax=Dermatophagoides farinae TaxID=6954 RepID=A0A922HML8_DERFA|nr:hypothetical protein DERF_013583 [Dermatophagoides farinae]